MALALGIPSGYGLLTLFLFGGAAFVCMMLAEDKKVLEPLFVGSRIGHLENILWQERDFWIAS